jgi:hypothetical protein
LVSLHFELVWHAMKVPNDLNSTWNSA